MSTTLPDVGEVKALDDWLGTTTPEAQTLKLYSNNITPAEGDTAGTYTECSGSGYAAKALARATWNAASTAAGLTTKTYPAQVFTFSAAITVYGYFIVGATSGTLLWSELLYPGGQAWPAAGGTLTLTPKIAMD